MMLVHEDFAGPQTLNRLTSRKAVPQDLKNRPIKGDYHGLSNNCNDWAEGAAKDCGLWCDANSYLVKPLSKK